MHKINMATGGNGPTKPVKPQEKPANKPKKK